MFFLSTSANLDNLCKAFDQKSSMESKVISLYFAGSNQEISNNRFLFGTNWSLMDILTVSKIWK